MEKADITYLSANELSRLIESKEVSPVEATEAYLERIDQLDFKFNAYLTVCRREALEAAREAEQAIVKGNYLGPMHGIPVAVKDQLWSKGIRSTGGSRILADFVPDEDATVVANLKRAGAILLGKTNLIELAIGGPHCFRTARNPWNLDMFAGRSSSGSAAATAAFLCATSLGEDTGGSVRQPAATCGLVGLCPGWGRVSRYGLMGGVWSMDVVGPISRTVEDAAITLGAIAGYDPKDPYIWNTPVPDYRKTLDGNIRGVRVGLMTELANSEEVEPEVREAVVNATALLGEIGASVEDVSIPLTRHSVAITLLMSLVEPASIHREWIRDRLHDYAYVTRVRLLTGSIMPAQAYYKAQKLRSLVRQQVREAFQRYDVLALPVSAKPAHSIEDGDAPLITSKGAASRPTYIFVDIFNQAGCPAISVPCGFSSEGMPIGLQIAGRPGGEEMVLKVAHAYEQNTTWHTARPPNA